MSDTIAAIDKALAEITARLNAKAPMYYPDDEWTRLSKAARALREAKRELEKPNARLDRPETAGRKDCHE